MDEIEAKTNLRYFEKIDRSKPRDGTGLKLCRGSSGL
jgi:hypothetical protein